MAVYGALAERMEMLADEVKASDGISRRQLSTDAGQSHDFVGTVISGRSADPGGLSLARICEAHGYNVRWLLTGLGPKLVDRGDDFKAARERGEPPPEPRGSSADEAARRVLEERRPKRPPT
jgi:hypothetical protein